MFEIRFKKNVEQKLLEFIGFKFKYNTKQLKYSLSMYKSFENVI